MIDAISSAAAGRGRGGHRWGLRRAMMDFASAQPIRRAVWKTRALLNVRRDDYGNRDIRRGSTGAIVGGIISYLLQRQSLAAAKIQHDNDRNDIRKAIGFSIVLK